MISSDIHILTTADLDKIKTAAFQRGVSRGKFEAAFPPQEKGAHRAEAGNPECPNVIEGDGPASHSDQSEAAE